MFFEQNAHSVGVRGLGAFQALGQQPVPQHIEPYTTQDGVLTLRYQGVWLHHPEQALLEAEAAVKALAEPGDNRVHVLIGLGLGYVLQELFTQKDGIIVVYEPYVDLLRFVMEHVSLSHLLASPRVYLVTDAQAMVLQIRQLFQAGLVSHLDVVMLPAYGKLLGDASYNQLARYLYELEGEHILQQRSRTRFADQWLTHVLTNTPLLAGSFPFEGLKGQYSHIPAFICDGSAHFDPDHFRGVDSKAIMLATVSGAMALMAHGITPDFVMVWDTEPADALLVKALHHGTGGHQPIQVILPLWAHASWFQLEDVGRWVISCQTVPEFHHWLELVYGEPLDGLPVCRSILTLGCHVAAWMGCHSIAIAGGQWETPPTHQGPFVPVDNARYAVTADVYYTLRELTEFAQQLPINVERLAIIQPCPFPVPGFTSDSLSTLADWATVPPVYKALYPLRSAFKTGASKPVIQALNTGVNNLVTVSQTLQADSHNPLPRAELEALIAQHPLIRFLVGSRLQQWLTDPSFSLVDVMQQVATALALPEATLPDTAESADYPVSWMGHAVTGSPETHWVLQAYIKQLRPDCVVLVNVESGTAMFTDWLIDYVGFGRFVVVVDAMPLNLPPLKRGRFIHRQHPATAMQLMTLQQEATVLLCQPVQNPLLLDTEKRQCLARDESISFWLTQP